MTQLRYMQHLLYQQKESNMAEIIRRDVGDKLKGFDLQRYKAVKYLLDDFDSDVDSKLLIAVEFEGDIFLNDEYGNKIVECKNYSSETKFTINSKEIYNTLVYFLHYWVKVKFSQTAKFGFYATTTFTKERKGNLIERLNITLPDKPILELLQNRELLQEKNDKLNQSLLDSVKKIILYRYSEQYKNVTENYIQKLENLDNEKWRSFLLRIDWDFGKPDEKALKDELLEKIKLSHYYNSKTRVYPEVILALILSEITEKQNESDILQRFFGKTELQNCFFKSQTQNINNSILEKIDIDYSAINSEVRKYSLKYIENKSKSISNYNNVPPFIVRKVAVRNSGIRINDINKLRENSIEPDTKLHTGSLKDILSFEKPNFLFGDLGSGKSTIVGQYILDEIHTNESGFLILIPANYFSKYDILDTSDYFHVISEFLKNEILFDSSYGIDFSIILRKGKEIRIIIDGFDELNLNIAKKLLSRSEKVSLDWSNVSVLATGRPVELQDLNYNDWRCLEVVPLTPKEIKQLLVNELKASGASEKESITEAESKWKLLEKRTEISSVCKTPLSVRVIAPFIDGELRDSSLGDLLYKVIKKRLDWDFLIDEKGNKFKNFFDHFPNTVQRERLLAEVAMYISCSPSSQISADRLYELIENYVGETDNKNQVIDEGEKYFLSTFLIKSSDNSYSFPIKPIQEFACGINIIEKFKRDKSVRFFEHNISHWREFSFAATVGRQKENIDDFVEQFEIFLNDILFDKLNSPAAAILVSESGSRELAKITLKKLKSMDYRPIRLFSSYEDLSIYSFSSLIRLVGDEGFDWFVNNYVDPIIPIPHLDIDFHVKILNYYLLQTDFKISSIHQEQIRQIIKCSLATNIFSAKYYFPTFSLILPNEFSNKNKYFLWGEALNRPELLNFARILIIEEFKNKDQYQNDILNALETVVCKNCNQNHKENFQPIKLWLELSEGEITKTIFDNSFKFLGGEHSHEMYKLLNSRIESLNEYIRYRALLGSLSASIFLYDKGERNIHYIGGTLISLLASWDSKEPVKRILKDIIADDIESSQDILIETFLSRHAEHRHGILWELFLESLLLAKELLLDKFYNAIRGINKHVLTRHPEVRELMRKLLISKPEYKSVLDTSLTSMDTLARHGSASILLVCFPEKEILSAEIIVRSNFSRLSDNHEWERFVLSLNLGETVCQHIYSILDDLLPSCRTYALALLFHNGYPLSNQHKKELIEAIAEEYSSLDVEWHFLIEENFGLKRIASESEYVEYTIPKLDDKGSTFYPAYALMEYHKEKLEDIDIAKCWTNLVETNLTELIEFDRKIFPKVQGDEALEYAYESFFNFRRTQGKEVLLSLYFKAAKNGKVEDWKNLLWKLVNNYDSESDMPSIITWLINKVKREKELKDVIGLAALEILKKPSLQNYNDKLSGGFAILAEEFEANIDTEQIEKLLLNTNLSTFDAKNMAYSLIRRIEYVPKDFSVGSVADFERISPHNHKASFYKKIEDEEAKLYLLDDSYQNELSRKIFDSFYMYSQPDLNQIFQEVEDNGLITYTKTVIAFCKNEDINIKDVFNLKFPEEIKYSFKRKKNFDIRTLNKIQKSLTSRSDLNREYEALLENEIQTSQGKIRMEIEKEFLNRQIPFTPSTFKNLLLHFINIPFAFDLRLLKRFSSYLANEIQEDQIVEIISILNTFIKSLVNQPYRRKFDTNDEFNLLMWFCSLGLLAFNKENSKEVSVGFLLGMKEIFIQSKAQHFTDGRQKEITSFIGRDLLIYSNELFERIPKRKLHDIFIEGKESTIPEISSLCNVLIALSGNGNLL